MYSVKYTGPKAEVIDNETGNTLCWTSSLKKAEDLVDRLNSADTVGRVAGVVKGATERLGRIVGGFDEVTPQNARLANALSMLEQCYELLSEHIAEEKSTTENNTTTECIS